MVFNVANAPGESADSGITLNKEFSLVYVETTRDVHAFLQTTAPNLTLEQDLGQVTVHEIGHQFELAHGEGADKSMHRDDVLNIMNSATKTLIPMDKFFFVVDDIIHMRSRKSSPGRK